MKLGTIAAFTIQGSHLAALMIGGLLLTVLVMVIVRQLETASWEQGIYLPRRFTLVLTIAVMLAFMLRIMFPGETVLAFSR